ncbi:MAG: outer membrane protein OmpA-like peptidoglycan-associated protein [Maribacter sp.]
MSGHPDNTGLAATNKRLGLTGANFVKPYFMRNGIIDAKIIAASKGQTDQVENNPKEEARIEEP